MRGIFIFYLLFWVASWRFTATCQTVVQNWRKPAS